MDQRTPYRQNQPTNVPRDLISSLASGNETIDCGYFWPDISLQCTGRSRNCALPAVADQWNLFHLQFFFGPFGECWSGNKNSGVAVNQSVGVSRRTKKRVSCFPSKKIERKSSFQFG